MFTVGIEGWVPVLEGFDSGVAFVAAEVRRDLAEASGDRCVGLEEELRAGRRERERESAAVVGVRGPADEVASNEPVDNGRDARRTDGQPFGESICASRSLGEKREGPVLLQRQPDRRKPVLDLPRQPRDRPTSTACGERDIRLGVRLLRGTDSSTHEGSGYATGGQAKPQLQLADVESKRPGICHPGLRDVRST